MLQAFKTMLELQDAMNKKVYPDWSDRGLEWYRAIWIECGELVEHYGYKWWKKQEPNIQQVQMEAIDIWHFGLSSFFKVNESLDEIAQRMCEELEGYDYDTPRLGVLELTETVAAHALNTHSFSLVKFWDLMHAIGLNFDELYRQYVGKNVLNRFRQDYGYKSGTYIKEWQGREDNEHLVEILAELDCYNSQFIEQLYHALKVRYEQN